MTSLADSFERFDRENPQVYALVDKYARLSIAAGRKRLSINLIFERIRWYTQVEVKGDDFKVNNNYRAFYARKFMRLNPEYAGFFSLRESVADERGDEGRRRGDADCGGAGRCGADTEERHNFRCEGDGGSQTPSRGVGGPHVHGAGEGALSGGEWCRRVWPGLPWGREPASSGYVSQ